MTRRAISLHVSDSCIFRTGTSLSAASRSPRLDKRRDRRISFAVNRNGNDAGNCSGISLDASGGYGIYFIRAFYSMAGEENQRIAEKATRNPNRNRILV